MLHNSYQLEESQVWDWNFLSDKCVLDKVNYQLEESQVWDWNLERVWQSHQPTDRYQLEESQVWDWNMFNLLPTLISRSYYQLEESQVWDWNETALHLSREYLWLSIRRISSMRLKQASVDREVSHSSAYQLEESQVWDWNGNWTFRTTGAVDRLSIRRISSMRLKRIATGITRSTTWTSIN